MIVGPSMPTPMTSRMPGTPAAPISWLTVTRSIGPPPCPPYPLAHAPPPAPPPAAVLLGPRHAREPRLGELALPGAAGVDVLVLVAGGLARGGLGLVLLQPRPDLLPELGLLRGVVEIHACSFLAERPSSTGRRARRRRRSRRGPARRPGRPSA